MTDIIRLAWRTFHAPKAGNTLAEYEDACAGDLEQCRFAIADGASESSFADAWARILVNAYVQNPGLWSGWLADARRRWRLQVQERDIPWYAEAKFEEGAFAAVLGIAFNKNRWRARAVGDCCLFQVRDNALLKAFPLRHSTEFSNRPSLLGSRTRQSHQPRTRRIHLHGDLHPEDVLYLMTDALAQWFLQQVESGRHPWTDLQAIETEPQFTQFVKVSRNGNEMRNDDVTIIMLNQRN